MKNWVIDLNIRKVLQNYATADKYGFTLVYSGDLKTDPSKTGNIRKPDYLVSLDHFIRKEKLCLCIGNGLG